MNLFGLYLGTTIVSATITITKAVALKKRLKREGYTLTDKAKNRSWAEHAVGFFQTLIGLTMPIYNVFNAAFLFFANKEIVFQIQSRRMVDKGIYERKSKDATEEESFSTEEKIKNAKPTDIPFSYQFDSEKERSGRVYKDKSTKGSYTKKR